MARFLVTIFLGAWLLFQVQPLLGKYILPWFGGGPAVWTACMLFFQAVLLAGYGYAHCSSAWLKPRRQAVVHLVFLGASLLLLPIGPDPALWKPAAAEQPTGHILLLLLANIGLPYLLLASTAPLVQRWFHAAYPARTPYPLYALSNAGSLLALLTYPVVVEPSLALGSQLAVWSWSYTGFVAVCGWCAIRFGWAATPAADSLAGEAGTAASSQAHNPAGSVAARRAGDPSGSEAGNPAALAGQGMGSENPRSPSVILHPSVGTSLFWLALSMCGSVLLLATTNQMSQEIPVIPFLWVLPLAIYLTTFLLVFHSDGWYDRRWYAIAVGVLVPVACGVMVVGLAVNLWVHLVADSLVLFACCMACHGELARSKPHPAYLTLYYLLMATGGALGGVFVALLAPAMFTTYAEYPLSLGFCCLLAAVGWYRGRAWTAFRGRPYWVIAPLSGLGMGLLAALVTWASDADPHVLARFRNFYGILRIQEQFDANGEKRLLTHGRVTHGFQYLDADKRRWPTTYFGPESGIGLAMRHHPRRVHAAGDGRALKVGVIGLGAGTIAAYLEPGDTLRFYELNPRVAWVAEHYFTFQKDAPARSEVVLGDARVQLERELAAGNRQQYDLFAVDAFSGGAIPTHLLTEECAEVYRQHLQRDGLLLFHISNQTVDLVPVVRGLAEALRLEALLVETRPDESRGISRSTWMILTSNQAFLNQPEVLAAASAPSAAAGASSGAKLAWTDDFASLWGVLKF
jgi:hypothetical protein